MKTHKDFIASLSILAISLLIAFVVLIPLPAFAQSNFLILPELSLQSSETGTFDMVLNNEGGGIAAGQIRVTYDSSVGFDITEVHPTARLDGFEITFHKDDSDPENVEALILFYSFNGVTIPAGSGALLTCDYHTTSSASGNSNLVFTEVLLSAQNASPLLVSSQNGSVEIVLKDPLEAAFIQEISGNTIFSTVTITNVFDDSLFLMLNTSLDAYVNQLAGTLQVNGVPVSDDVLFDYTSDWLNPGDTLTISFALQMNNDFPEDWFITTLIGISSYIGGFGSPFYEKDLFAQIQSPNVPEPGTFLMMGVGLLGLFGWRRWKKRT